ncbi:MAG: serine/threonine protein kinase, partial [Rhodothermales bacterium]
MSSSSDYLLDSVISEALELPSSLRQEYVRKALQAQPSLISVAMDLLNGMENMPNSFLDKLPVVPDAGSLFEGFQESTDTALKPGDKFKSFEILKLLDEGGMGKVYLAEQKTERIKRKVAIKVVHGDLATTEVLKRFKHEQKILSELQHANIATLFDADVTEQGTPYLVMEYIEGKHIDVHCDAKSLSIKERLKLFKTVCDAVQYAQDNLIVHRDLKPSNILITKKGRDVKLLDFGIAKLKDTAQEILKSEHKGPTVNGAATKGAATNSFTPNGSVANGFDKNDQLNGVAKHTNITNINAPYTPAYAAPEQFAGEPVNAATDVYSLGVILFKLLTGLLPQKGEEQTAEEDQESTSGKTTTNQLKPSRQLTRYKTEEDKTKKEEASRVRGNKNLTHLKRELSGDLDAIVIKALEEKGKDRYASAGELGRDIQRYLDRRPIQARPQTLRYRSAKFVRRYHRTAIAALIGFLVLIGGI